MKRLLAVLLFVVALPAGAQQETSFVYVVKPGKTPLKAEPRMEAGGKGIVAYGQKLKVEEKNDRWIRVSVPGDANASGWIVSTMVVDKRPTLEKSAIAAGGGRVVANEMSTAGAIRGLDNRASQYAQAKQIPPAVIAQLASTESFGEGLFADRHNVDRSGRWRYPDVTVPGRIDGASKFANAEGLRPPRAPQPK